MSAEILSWEERHRRRLRRERLQRFVVAFWAILILVVAFTLIYLSMARAEWKPEYASQPAQVQAWYERAILTPAAQKRLGFVGCCKYADVVKTQFRVDTSSGAPHWFYLKDGKFEPIPDDIVHWDEQAPDNKPTLFALSEQFGPWPAGTLTCFYPPGGGF